MLGNSLYTTNKWRNILTAISVSFFVLGTIIFTACESAVQEDGVFAEGLARSAASVRQAIPISSADELAEIGITLPANGEYVLTANLTLPATWVPVCPNTTNPFTGKFDGNEKSITVTGFDTSGTSPYIGIFGVVGDGTVNAIITSLNVNVDAIVTFATATAGMEPNVGIVAGYAGNEEGGGGNVFFSNINVNGSLNVSYEFPDTVNYTGLKVGGIVGAGDYVSIIRCQSTLNITARGDGFATSAGSLAGYVRESSIISSSAKGNVDLTAVSYNFDWSDSWNIYAGGLLGYQGRNSFVSKCYATGNVSANAPFPYAGGLTAYNYGYNDFENPPNQGSLISQSYATGTVTATAQTFSYGLPYAGGLSAYSSILDSLIEDCYATGDVTAATDGNYAWAGGLIGANAYNSVVTRCYASGTVTASCGGNGDPLTPPNGADTGASAGGIVGQNYYSYNETNTATTVQYCAALNQTVTSTSNGTGITSAHRVAGGLGTNYEDTEVEHRWFYPGRLTHNYGNSSMTLTPGPETAIGWDNLGGADLRVPATQGDFATGLNWDFRTVWVWDIANNVPILQWQL